MLNLPDGEVLYSQEVIQKRVAELAGEIELKGVEYDCVVCVLKGAVFFFADLIRAFEQSYSYDFIAASSYVDTQSSGRVVVHQILVGNLVRKRLLLVDDICDTGRTIQVLCSDLVYRGAEVEICCLLNRGVANVDFCGFELNTKEFLVGYGMDRNDEYRNLPHIYMVGT